MRRRATIVATLAAAGALLASVLSGVTTAQADPGDSPARHQTPPQPLTVAQAQRRLTTLDRQAEVASEAFNTVRVHVREADSRMRAFRANLVRQQVVVADLRRDLVGAALSTFQNTGGLSASAAFLVAKTPSQFLNSLATTAIVQHQQADLLTRLTQQTNLLRIREQQAQHQLATIVADRRQLAAHKAQLDKEVKAAHGLVSRLKQKQRQRLLALRRHQTTDPANYNPPSRAGERPPTQQAPPTSGRAAIAVATALAQVGKPYVYGAAGPYSFDCSGLTMYSWAAAGVSLSHSSSVQSGQGVPVSISELQPGDLVFYYSPVSHVAMYIGNGMVVHAPHPGSVVQVVPLYSMPVSWARRVG